LEGHERNFATDSKNVILATDLLINLRFISLRNSDLLCRRQLFLSSKLFNLGLLGFILHFEDWECRVFLSIQSIDGIDQKLDKNSHLLIVLDHQVDIPIDGLDRNTVPTIKRELLLLIFGHRIDVFS
jgi:hypothetical protein